MSALGKTFTATLPVKVDLRKAIGKEEGDTVTVHLQSPSTPDRTSFRTASVCRKPHRRDGPPVSDQDAGLSGSPSLKIR